MAFRVINTQPYLTEEARAYMTEHDCEVVDRFAPNCFLLDSSSDDEYSRAVMDADATIAGGEFYTDKILNAVPSLRIIARTGAGIDHVDVDLAARNGIWVTNTPQATSGAVSDMTLCLILCSLRNVPSMTSDMKDGKWNQFRGRELVSQTVGIIGTGSIGRATIIKLRGFGAKVIAYDIAPDEKFAAQWQVEYLELDEVLARADIVSLHVPLIESTTNLINEPRLRLMKKTAYLVNTARSGVVDKQALARILQENVIAGAVLDVHDPAPCKPDDPLVVLDNVIATPWIAYNTIEAVAAMCLTAAHDIVAVSLGTAPKYPVNRPKL